MDQNSQFSAQEGQANNLQIFGSGFIQGANVQVNGNTLFPNPIASGLIRVNVPANLMTAPSISIVVNNPQPCTNNQCSSFPSNFTVTGVAQAPVITSFLTANGTQNITITQGNSTTLSWSTQNADDISIDNGVGNNLPASGQVQTPVLDQTTVFTMSASGPGGSAAPQSVTVTVNNAPPQLTATITNPSNNFQATVGQPVNFTASPPQGGVGPYTYEWVGGDGLQGNSPTIQHTYLTAGPYNIALHVKDSLDDLAVDPNTGLVPTVDINVVPAPQGPPTVTNLNPQSGPQHQFPNSGVVVVTGSNFSPDSTVFINGGSRSTSFISPTQLQTNVNDLDGDFHYGIDVVSPSEATQFTCGVCNATSGQACCLHVTGGSSSGVTIETPNYIDANSVQHSLNRSPGGYTTNDPTEMSIVYPVNRLPIDGNQYWGACSENGSFIYTPIVSNSFICNISNGGGLHTIAARVASDNAGATVLATRSIDQFYVDFKAIAPNPVGTADPSHSHLTFSDPAYSVLNQQLGINPTYGWVGAGGTCSPTGTTRTALTGSGPDFVLTPPASGGLNQTLCVFIDDNAQPSVTTTLSIPQNFGALAPNINMTFVNPSLTWYRADDVSMGNIELIYNSPIDVDSIDLLWFDDINVQRPATANQILTSPPPPDVKKISGLTGKSGTIPLARVFAPTVNRVPTSGVWKLAVVVTLAGGQSFMTIFDSQPIKYDTIDPVVCLQIRDPKVVANPNDDVVMHDSCSGQIPSQVNPTGPVNIRIYASDPPDAPNANNPNSSQVITPWATAPTLQGNTTLIEGDDANGRHYYAWEGISASGSFNGVATAKDNAGNTGTLNINSFSLIFQDIRVTGFKATDTPSLREINYTWTAPQAPADHYVFYFNYNGIDTRVGSNIPGNSNPPLKVNFTSFQGPGSVGNFKVTGAYLLACPTASDCDVTTGGVKSNLAPDYFTQAAPPSGAQVTASDATSATIQWDTANNSPGTIFFFNFGKGTTLRTPQIPGNATGPGCDNCPQISLPSPAPATLSLTATGRLDPNTKYELAAAAKNQNNPSDYTAVIWTGEIFWTLPKPPVTVAAKIFDPTSINVDFTPPTTINPPGQLYYIRYRLVGANTWNGTRPMGATSPIKVAGLSHGALYEFNACTQPGSAGTQTADASDVACSLVNSQAGTKFDPPTVTIDNTKSTPASFHIDIGGTGKPTCLKVTYSPGTTPITQSDSAGLTLPLALDVPASADSEFTAFVATIGSGACDATDDTAASSPANNGKAWTHLFATGDPTPVLPAGTVNLTVNYNDTQNPPTTKKYFNYGPQVQGQNCAQGPASQLQTTPKTGATDTIPSLQAGQSYCVQTVAKSSFNSPAFDEKSNWVSMSTRFNQPGQVQPNNLPTVADENTIGIRIPLNANSGASFAEFSFMPPTGNLEYRVPLDLNTDCTFLSNIFTCTVDVSGGTDASSNSPIVYSNMGFRNLKARFTSAKGINFSNTTDPFSTPQPLPAWTKPAKTNAPNIPNAPDAQGNISASFTMATSNNTGSQYFLEAILSPWDWTSPTGLQSAPPANPPTQGTGSTTQSIPMLLQQVGQIYHTHILSKSLFQASFNVFSDDAVPGIRPVNAPQSFSILQSVLPADTSDTSLTVSIVPNGTPVPAFANLQYPNGTTQGGTFLFPNQAAQAPYPPLPSTFVLPGLKPDSRYGQINTPVKFQVQVGLTPNPDPAWSSFLQASNNWWTRPAKPVGVQIISMTSNQISVQFQYPGAASQAGLNPSTVKYILEMIKDIGQDPNLASSWPVTPPTATALNSDQQPVTNPANNLSKILLQNVAVNQGDNYFVRVVAVSDSGNHGLDNPSDFTSQKLGQFLAPTVHINKNLSNKDTFDHFNITISPTGGNQPTVFHATYTNVGNPAISGLFNKLAETVDGSALSFDVQIVNTNGISNSSYTVSGAVGDNTPANDSIWVAADNNSPPVWTAPKVPGEAYASIVSVTANAIQLGINFPTENHLNTTYELQAVAADDQASAEALFAVPQNLTNGVVVRTDRFKAADTVPPLQNLTAGTGYFIRTFVNSLFQTSFSAATPASAFPVTTAQPNASGSVIKSSTDTITARWVAVNTTNVTGLTAGATDYSGQQRGTVIAITPPFPAQPELTVEHLPVANTSYTLFLIPLQGLNLTPAAPYPSSQIFPAFTRAAKPVTPVLDVLEIPGNPPNFSLIVIPDFSFPNDPNASDSLYAIEITSGTDPTKYYLNGSGGLQTGTPIGLTPARWQAANAAKLTNAGKFTRYTVRILIREKYSIGSADEWTTASDPVEQSMPGGDISVSLQTLARPTFDDYVYGVSLNSPLVLRFTARMKSASLTGKISIKAVDTQIPVTINPTYQDLNGLHTLSIPVSGLQPATAYTIEFQPGMQDFWGFLVDQTPPPLKFITALNSGAATTVYSPHDTAKANQVSSQNLGSDSFIVLRTTFKSPSWPFSVGSNAPVDNAINTTSSFRKIKTIEVLVYNNVGGTAVPTNPPPSGLALTMSASQAPGAGASALNSAIDPSTLIIYQFVGNAIQPVKDQKNNGNGTVTATIKQSGVYILGGIIAINLSNAHAFPVPFKPSDGHTKITFTDLAADSVVKVYTIMGELVKQLDTPNANGDIEWFPVTNKDGDNVASGVYVYQIKNSFSEKRGKLVVIR